MRRRSLLLSLVLAGSLSACGSPDREQASPTPIPISELPGAKPKPKPRQASFLSLSDIHFDPFADPERVPQLIAAEPEQWRAIFTGAADPPGAQPPNAQPPEPQALSGYGHDSDFALLDATLTALRTEAAAGERKPEFVILSGDFLAHRFRERYDALAGPDHAGDEAYRRFVAKTMAFVSNEIAASVGDLPVFPALGNNDGYCGDYQQAPGGAFLTMLTPLWQPLVDRQGGAPDFAASFQAGGYYQVRSPSAPEHRIVVLNSTFFSAKYDSACAQADPASAAREEPVEAQLEWLSTTLTAATKAGERVWLVYHIPPGIDVFASTRAAGAAACGSETVSFWRPGVATAFLKLVDEHRDTVTASFAGHIHTDDFRLRVVDDQVLGFIHLTPAISPVFGNNPGYQRFDFEAHAAELLDYRTQLLDLAAPTPTWREGYRFLDSYGLSPYDGENLALLRRRLADDADLRGTFIQHYDVDNPDNQQIDAHWRDYWCGAGTMTAADYVRCACGAAG